jgi:NAD(P)-dependent dehydrogenase (short-subunit alcohol dehydrogenase family)
MNYIKSLAKQLGPKGIRLNGVAPGPIWKPLQVSAGASMEKLQKFGGQTPLGRPANPQSLDRSMCSSRQRTPASLPGRSMALPAAPGSPDGAHVEAQ